MIGKACFRGACFKLLFRRDSLEHVEHRKQTIHLNTKNQRSGCPGNVLRQSEGISGKNRESYFSDVKQENNILETVQKKSSKDVHSLGEADYLCNLPNLVARS